MNDDTGELVPIPGGVFWMGCDTPGDHSPAHKVTITPFSIEKYEVTNAAYHRFCAATGHRLPEFWDREGFRCGLAYPLHPVVGVSWQDAVEYATWLGRRLPSEAEWEVAARGGKEGLSFPNTDILTPADGNYAVSDLGGPVAVGSYPANGYGLFDVQGNVLEWVADFYAADYYLADCTENPPGPGTGRFKVIRGGGWHSGATCNRVYYRNALPANWVDFNVGFRCAS
jgi:formylglycine-generating enzyme required for sulfatase activity